MLPYNLVTLGPQGSGKGTQNELLSKKFDMPILIAGDLIRTKAKENDALGKRLRDIINRGHLIPHNDVKNLFIKATKNLQENQTIIFDAWPRAMAQVPGFIELIRKRVKKEFKILVIKISVDEAIKRLSKRRVCESCQTNFMPPESLTLKKCPKCQGKIIQREDDYPKPIKTRLDVYGSETKPVIKYFAKKNKVIYINGEQSIENVQKEILAKLPKE